MARPYIGREMSAYQTLVVGTDGSDTSLRAVDHAAAVAAENNAKLIFSCRKRQLPALYPQPYRHTYRTDSKSTAPATMDQLRLMLCAMLGCGSQTH